MEALFGTEPLKTKTGEITPMEAFKDAKMIGVYCSMHNCPPCREFTPLLIELYKEFNADSKQFEIVFLSGDKTQEQFDTYYEDMPWVALKRGDARMKHLATTLGVKGVPRLIILKPDGTILANDDVVKKVTAEGPAAIEEFLAQC